MYIDAIELFPYQDKLPDINEIQDKYMIQDGYRYLTIYFK
jgi:hypothetical protein